MSILYLGREVKSFQETDQQIGLNNALVDFVEITTE
jgi:hypothetical protein